MIKLLKSKMAKKPVYEQTVTMKLSEFIEEHANLIDILRNGTKTERNAEADRQEAELHKYKP